MERGDIVEVQGWSDYWNGRIAIVSSIDSRYVYIRPIITGPEFHAGNRSDAGFPACMGYGFYAKQLKVLGHIDVAPSEGEKRCAEGI